MKQKDFLKAVQQETGIDAARVGQLTVSMTESIRSMLTCGDSLSIQGFGSFEVRHKEERLSVHPVTGKRFMVPPKIVPVFRPGGTMKDRVLNVVSNAGSDVSLTGKDGQ